MWAWLIPAISSLATGYLQGQAGQKAAGISADAQYAAAQAALQQYYDAVARTEPWRQSGLAALNFTNQWLGLPQVNDNAALALRYGNPTSGVGGTGPAGAAPEKKSMLPSLSGAITNSDHSPSVYGRFVEGAKNGESDAEWLAHGGASVLGSLSAGGTNQISQALGLGKATDTMDRLFGIQKKSTDNIKQWGTPLANSKNANSFDYAGYVEANPDVKNAFDALNPKDKSFILKSYDVNGDGQLSEGEYGQFHYDQFGKNEGRTINSPEQAAAIASGTAGAGDGTAPGTTSTTTGNTLGPNSDFWAKITNNPLYIAATQGFTGIDGIGGTKQALDAKYGAAGKVGSGAAVAANKLAQTRNSFDALNNIYGQYADAAGLGYQATSQDNTLGANATQSSNLFNIDAANSRASGYAALTKGIANGVSGAINSFDKYGAWAA